MLWMNLILYDSSIRNLDLDCVNVQNGKEIVPDNRMQVEINDDEVILTCRSAVKADQGKYSVTLKNPKGSDTAKVNVSVSGKSL
jgi:hypothetical protein